MENCITRPFHLAMELSRLFNLNSSLETELTVAMYTINQHMASERSSIFLFDQWKQQLSSFSSLDLAKQEVRISVSTGVAGWVFDQCKPEVVNDAYEDRRFYSGVDQLTGFRTRNLICTPLIDDRGNCLGTLQSLNKKCGDYTKDDLELLRHIAGLVAVAINNSKRKDDSLAPENTCAFGAHLAVYEIGTLS